MPSLSSRRLAVLLATAALLPVRMLSAQQGPPVATPVPAPVPTPAPPAAPFVMPASAADTIEVIITSRSVDTVRAEKDQFLSARRDMETQWAALRDQTQRLKYSITELERAVDAASEREKVAKKEKRDADRIAAQVEKRRLERSLEIVEARAALRQAQSEQARLERDLLDASIRADDAELAIAERRTQVLADDPSQRGAFQELTNRWLQALRTRAARAYDVEDRRFKVVEAQLNLLKRQRD
ncbi:MAG: hypothetical protein IT355_11545 [Gemmatimonadaceae bacterium]|nr:hypothetical protein [Gemmatimonadaceae bacterium]